MQITNIPGWAGLLMQTNATIPTRWSVLGVRPTSSSSWYLFYMFAGSYRRSSRVEVSNVVMLETGNYVLVVKTGKTSTALWQNSQQEVEQGFSEWRRITEVWLLSAIIRVVQAELTLPSLTLSCRQTSVRPPCQAGLAWVLLPVRWWTCN